MPETKEQEVHYFKGNHNDSIFQADLYEVAVSQIREFDGKTFSPVWMVQTDPDPYEGHPNGEWQVLLESDPKFAKYKAKGAQMFPKETITLVFLDRNDKEIRWDLGNKLGYTYKGQTKVKEIDRALAEAAGREPGYYVEFTRMDRRAAEIGKDLGGACLTVSTPSFPLKGDNREILKRLIEEKWVAPMSDEEIEAAAERGFISRPYRIVNSGVGTHEFQGVVSWVQAPDAGATQSDTEETAEPAQLFKEDVPF